MIKAKPRDSPWYWGLHVGGVALPTAAESGAQPAQQGEGACSQPSDPPHTLEDTSAVRFYRGSRGLGFKD